DKEAVFDEDSIEEAKIKYEISTEILNRLINVKQNFSVDEYEKSRNFVFVNEKLLGDNNLLNALLIRNFYNQELHSQLNIQNSKIQRANKFLTLKANDLIDKGYFELFFNGEEKYEEYKLVERAIIKLNEDLGTVGKLLAHFNNVIQTDHISNTNCPLCNTSFSSFDELLSAIETKTNLIQDFNKAKLEEIARLEVDLKKYNEIIKEKVDLFLKDNFIYDESILGILREQE